MAKHSGGAGRDERVEQLVRESAARLQRIEGLAAINGIAIAALRSISEGGDGFSTTVAEAALKRIRVISEERL